MTLLKSSRGRWSFWAVGLIGLCLGWLSEVPMAMAAKPEKKDDFINPFGSRMISLDEYAVVELAALQGNPEAAFRIMVHYETAMQFDKVIFWGSIAAENGNHGAMYNLGFRLSESPDPKQRIRARFWLKKAIEGGGETGRIAAAFLREVESKDRSEKTTPVVLPERYPKW